MADPPEPSRSRPRQRIRVHNAAPGPQPAATPSRPAAPVVPRSRSPFLAGVGAAAAAGSSLARAANADHLGRSPSPAATRRRPAPPLHQELVVRSRALHQQHHQQHQHQQPIPPQQHPLAARLHHAQQQPPQQQQQQASPPHRRSHPYPYPTALATVVPSVNPSASTSAQVSASSAGAAPAVVFVARNGTTQVRRCVPPHSSTNPTPAHAPNRPSGNSRLLRYLNAAAPGERFAATGRTHPRRDQRYYRAYLQNIERRIESRSETRNTSAGATSSRGTRDVEHRR